MMKKYVVSTVVAAGIVFAPSVTDAALLDNGSMEYGDVNSSVNVLQEELKAKGHFEGSTGNRFGPRTLSAVQSYQSENGISSSAGNFYGVAGPATQSAIWDGEVKGASTSDSSSGSSDSGIISTAKDYVGVPYSFGGTSPSGFDCSGFLNYVFDQHGKDIPRTVSAIYSASTEVADPSPGDIVFFDTRGGASHAGIYIGGNEFIHTSSSNGVTIDSLDNSYWEPRYMGAGTL
ncbi:cell wall-associated NlpC family hydrolase [Geomicrobium halophilum]|uniref:Cell wall-associated NlpC family hydrolase n=1 Tax=Geomicrobium halophilum TaxID=549000 RepID=A0A841PNX8_9BACL|nr:NlpC/P60 family protein [Geomicrobium halophilum]MBB6450537.1 cell wall-associated NlpC family hydrolase [Geomicrobium halophilum]